MNYGTQVPIGPESFNLCVLGVATQLSVWIEFSRTAPSVENIILFGKLFASRGRHVVGRRDMRRPTAKLNQVVIYNTSWATATRNEGSACDCRNVSLGLVSQFEPSSTFATNDAT